MELEIRDTDFWDIDFRPSEPKSASGICGTILFDGNPDLQLRVK